MHAKHKGHEAMHAEMVLILIVTLVVAQLVLVQWKQRHPKSYNVRCQTHKFCVKVWKHNPVKTVCFEHRLCTRVFVVMGKGKDGIHYDTVVTSR